MEIGHIIRSARLTHGFTLEQLALSAGTDASNLSRIERGKQRVSLQLLDRIAAALGLAVSSLLPSSATTGLPTNVAASTTEVEVEEGGERYRNEIVLLRRSFMSLNHENRILAVEFVKLLSRTQREQSE